MKYQFVYPAGLDDKNVDQSFLPEYNALKALGAYIDIKAHDDADILILRSFLKYEEKEYPSDHRYLNTWENYNATNRMSLYYPLIENLSIPTFFVNDLNDNTIGEIQKRGWGRVYIKNDIKSLWCIDAYASAWPNHSLNEIKAKLSKRYRLKDTFAIRKFIDPKVFYEEDRYWVINGKIYHRTNNIPNIVKEAAERLAILGSHYYTIDATPEFIVEVNPGESSDRYACNPPELFASWLVDGFGIK